MIDDDNPFKAEFDDDDEPFDLDLEALEDDPDHMRLVEYVRANLAEFGHYPDDERGIHLTAIFLHMEEQGKIVRTGEKSMAGNGLMQPEFIATGLIPPDA